MYICISVMVNEGADIWGGIQGGGGGGGGEMEV